MLFTRILPLSVFSFFAAIGPNAYAGSFSAVYSFGDSLSDTGNIYLATGGATPAAPYFAGRFSNGPNWIDALSHSLGLPDQPSLAGGTDYAVGGAETGATPLHTATAIDLLGTGGQIAQFTAAHATADPNALYTIWIGSNDVYDLLAASPGLSLAQISADIAAIVTNVDTAIADLAALGARNFLVATVPDLGKTPAGSVAAAAASAAALQVDSTLVGGAGPIPSLAALSAGLGLNLKVLDTYSLLDAVVANGVSYGFTNTTAACLVGTTPCANPNQYLFWDSKHPTSAADAILGADALALVVPEPTTWLAAGLGIAMMLAGRKLGRS